MQKCHKKRGFKKTMSCFKNIFSFLFFFVIKLFPFILHTDHAFPPCSPPISSSHLPSIPSHLNWLLLHSQRSRPPMAVNTAWHIKLRQDQTPPPVSKLGKATQLGDCVPKSHIKGHTTLNVPDLVWSFFFSNQCTPSMNKKWFTHEWQWILHFCLFEWCSQSQARLAFDIPPPDVELGLRAPSHFTHCKPPLSRIIKSCKVFIFLRCCHVLERFRENINHLESCNPWDRLDNVLNKDVLYWNHAQCSERFLIGTAHR